MDGKCMPPNDVPNHSLHWVGHPLGLTASDREPMVWLWWSHVGKWETPIGEDCTPEEAWTCGHRYLGIAKCPYDHEAVR